MYTNTCCCLGTCRAKIYFLTTTKQDHQSVSRTANSRERMTEGPEAVLKESTDPLSIANRPVRHTGTCTTTTTSFTTSIPGNGERSPLQPVVTEPANLTSPHDTPNIANLSKDNGNRCKCTYIHTYTYVEHNLRA